MVTYVQARLTQSLAAVWHHISLLMPFTGSIGPIVQLHGLTGEEKPSVKADSAMHTNIFGVPGQC